MNEGVTVAVSRTATLPSSVICTPCPVCNTAQPNQPKPPINGSGTDAELIRNGALRHTLTAQYPQPVKNIIGPKIGALRFSGFNSLSPQHVLHSR
jgi:hypothetical protein